MRQSFPAKQNQRNYGYEIGGIRLPKPASLYQLKITLEDIHPFIWRRFVVPATIRLSRLHAVIQIVMGWEDCHMHLFKAGESMYGDDPEPTGHFRAETNVKLSDLLIKPKDWLRYDYDMGDSWSHKLLLEKILESSSEMKPYSCLDAKRACPPEDCGGWPGYENLLDVLANRKHPEYSELKEWSGGSFDPERVFVNDINHRLAVFSRGNWGVWVKTA
ncbi:MAG TPA: plasmid pRiA4b ORF-3 family protein [Methylocella sp.]